MKVRLTISGRALAVTLAVIFASAWPAASEAGTTGGIAGRITDATTQAPIANVTVTVVSPSQRETTTSDANGDYRFLTLSPDAYTIGFSKAEYDPVSNPGVNVFADQVQNVNVAMNRTLKEIARTTSRAAGSIVRPGTTSDVYSVNAAGAAAASGLIGPGSLSNAYGAIASVPGVAVDPGEQGWWQTVHIRGGDIDQVGYELDGIPVNRAYDNAPQTMLSSLGQQELQVYTGGTPASADAQGIAGYVNQVVKTGTYPGFGTIDASIGGSAFYHQLSAETGGSDPNRTFSYYAGFAGANQSYRYVDSDNGAGDLNGFFWPYGAFNPGAGPVYTGGPAPNIFASGIAYGIAGTEQRDNVVNLHFGIPHKHDAMRDDAQILYLTSEVFTSYYSSNNDLGPAVAASAFGTPTWDDAYLYTGPELAPYNPSDLQTYYFPSSQPHPFQGVLPNDLRDTNDNGVAVVKAQYQHTFSSKAFLRFYGYSLYSNWFIWGPNSAGQNFGGELADYEIPDHTYGFNLNFTDQLSDKHLFSLSGSYTASHLQRYYSSFYSTHNLLTLLTNPSGSTCYDATGTPVGCYDSTVASGNPSNPTPFAAPAGTQWTVVEPSLRGALNQVHPQYTSVSATDEWRPNEKLTMNLGARLEDYRFYLGDTSPNDPARRFWFAHYNAEYCYASGLPAPVEAGLGACPVVDGLQTVRLDSSPQTMLQNVSGGTLSATRFQPRIGATLELNPDTVLRASYGVYARPEDSSWVQYNTVQEDLATYLGSHFYSYGFRTPAHDISPDTSYNADFSLEKRLHGTDWSYKITPFYRSTKDQLQNFFIDPLTGLESGLNVGHQISSGVEVAVRKGDFSREGWSGQLSYTYTRSRIQYHNFANSSSNVIDNLNTFIQQYNSYTPSCAPSNSGWTSNPAAMTSLCGSLLQAQANSAPTLVTNSGITVQNPYYAAGTTAQPLLDRNAYYTTYDVIPGPVSGANGYETPDVAALILNYKHQRFAITPSFSYTSGASYGSPLVWPGIVPQNCTATLAGTTKPDPSFCNNGNLPLFIPDVYTGRFDSLGDFRQPWRITANLGLTYDVGNRVTARLNLTNLVDHCGQRGYAWDNPNTCVYAALPSGVFYPAGNFYPNSQSAVAPVQMQYPYSFWLNNNNTGFVGVKIPFQAVLSVDIKL